MMEVTLTFGFKRDMNSGLLGESLVWACHSALVCLITDSIEGCW